MKASHLMHGFTWALNEWTNGRSAVRKRWDNTAECRVDDSTKQLFNVTLLGERIETMRNLDWSDISAVRLATSFGPLVEVNSGPSGKACWTGWNRDVFRAEA
jgi:hypothetical protein